MPWTGMPVALLIAGSIDGKGGAAMRWRALRDALGGGTACAVTEIGCDRWGRCREVCATTGSPRPDGLRSERYVDRAYCDSHADGLVATLAATGTSTVICSGLDTYRYVARLAGSGDLHVIFDMHNVEAPLHRAIAAAIPAGSPFAPYFTASDLEAVAQAECIALEAAHEVWTCSAGDRLLTRATYPDAATAPVRVIPNVVEVTAGPAVPAPEPGHVSFTGRMDFYPNVVASRMLIEEVAPVLTELGCRLPVLLAGARLWPTLFGPELPPNVRLISDPDTTAGVIGGSIMAIPLSMGSGSRLKVLEAFALGAPVVSTDKGVEGLDVVAGVHYRRAEEPREFAESIVALGGDHQMRTDLVTAAWQLVHDRYSVDSLRVRLSETYGAVRRSSARG